MDSYNMDRLNTLTTDSGLPVEEPRHTWNATRLCLNRVFRGRRLGSVGPVADHFELFRPGLGCILLDHRHCVLIHYWHTQLSLIHFRVMVEILRAGWIRPLAECPLDNRSDYWPRSAELYSLGVCLRPARGLDLSCAILTFLAWTPPCSFEGVGVCPALLIEFVVRPCGRSVLGYIYVCGGAVSLISNRVGCTTRGLGVKIWKICQLLLSMLSTY